MERSAFKGSPMAVDHIRYDILAQDALRGLVRKVLMDTAKNGLPGEHHFYISFDTRADGVRLSPRMRAQYPEEMTVVLQHQFWDLEVTESGFEVGVSFGGIPERVAVPFAAVKASSILRCSSACSSRRWWTVASKNPVKPDRMPLQGARATQRGQRSTPRSRRRCPSPPILSRRRRQRTPKMTSRPAARSCGSTVFAKNKVRKK